MDSQTMLLPLETATAIRYITPLREGGSLPAVVEADDGNMHVMKFIGAGQGAKVLTAEVIAGAIAAQLGFNMPAMTLLHLDPMLAQTDRHEEILDLLRASTGINLGFRFLENAFAYNPMLRSVPLTATLASQIVWFDSYIMNVDRTPRNVNLLLAEGKLWVIDHGASLYFHHTWGDMPGRAANPFAFVKEHTLLPFASEVAAVDAGLRALLPDEFLRAVVELPPAEWLEEDARVGDAVAQRQAYFDFLRARRDASSLFVPEAVRAHSLRV